MSRIEDEYDLHVFEEYEKDKTSGKVEYLSHEDEWSELDL